MEKYKYKRKLITVKCDGCGNDFEKPESEYNRNLKFNRRNFCNRVCVGKHHNAHLKIYKFDLTPNSGNRKDEYTPYKYYMKVIKQRFKDYDVTLESLKNQWIKQKGICPYSGIQLQLSTHSNIIKDPIYAASVDRIDSSKGYVVNNIQFVSQAINYMKSTMNHKKTLELCQLIANYYKI